MSSEQFAPYNKIEAEEEALRLRMKVESREALDYDEADSCRMGERSQGRTEVIQHLLDGDFDAASEASMVFGLLQEDVRIAAENAFIASLNGLYEERPLEIARLYKLSGEFMESAEIREGLVFSLCALTACGEVDVFNLATQSGLSEEYLMSDEVREIVQDVMIDQLQSGDCYVALSIANQFQLSSKFIASEEVRTAARKGIITRLNIDDLASALDMIDLFDLTDEDLRAIEHDVSDVVAKYLEIGDVETAQSIAREFIRK